MIFCLISYTFATKTNEKQSIAFYYYFNISLLFLHKKPNLLVVTTKQLPKKVAKTLLYLMQAILFQIYTTDENGLYEIQLPTTSFFVKIELLVLKRCTVKNFSINYK
jgi:hypothetical protein